MIWVYPLYPRRRLSLRGGGGVINNGILKQWSQTMDEKLCPRCGLMIMTPELTLKHGWLEFYGGCECEPLKTQIPLFPGERALLESEE